NSSKPPFVSYRDWKQRVWLPKPFVVTGKSKGTRYLGTVVNYGDYGFFVETRQKYCTQIVGRFV
ncbi:hypothetical protein, partial [Stenotrophomonas maltophilia group sp. RNC7]|uniref:hypothetical protein n=1 Tax=Stenotrophomonas maltophilia group sp. RNC7 TaxID=3071467 RepID=UPI0027DFCE8D